MELKEYLRIIERELRLFVAIILIVIISTLLYFLSLPQSFDTSLTLNVTRIGTQETQGFRYDDFYRLQADEKFSETVVEWLKSPRIVSDIYSEAGVNMSGFSIKRLSKALKAEKRSSQLIAVSFSSPDQKTAEKVSLAISKIISQNTQEMNKDQKEETWFEVVPENPVIVKSETSTLLVLIISAAAGIFLAFWAVMAKHYVKE